MEQWKPIVGYEGLYMISDLGRVKSLTNRGKGRIMKTKLTRLGYPRVNLSKDKVKKTHEVHRLVTRAFLGPTPPGMECCHNDGNKLNCSLSNLRYGTKMENERDKIDHGTYRTNVKLTEDDVLAIRFLHYRGIDKKTLASTYGTTPENIRHVVLRNSWKDV